MLNNKNNENLNTQLGSPLEKNKLEFNQENLINILKFAHHKYSKIVKVLVDKIG